MVQFFKIKEIHPLSERQYTDRQGQPQVFTSQEFVLTDGINTVCAYTSGNYAKAVQGLKLAEGDNVVVTLTWSARSWTTTEGEIRWSNEVNISNIAKY